ncbi:hypothetical protein, partial [Agrobacterium vitis]|uniref:hypothetical protein n=1 Tax=Agrobacterium vitis TaxID=373 RepID=UPI001AEF21B1
GPVIGRAVFINARDATGSVAAIGGAKQTITSRIPRQNSCEPAAGPRSNWLVFYKAGHPHLGRTPFKVFIDR